MPVTRSQYAANINREQNENVPPLVDIEFPNLTFYRILDTIMKPTALKPCHTGPKQKMFLRFLLTPQQVGKATRNSQLLYKSKGAQVIHVQLRFCLLKKSTKPRNMYPEGLRAWVNDRFCMFSSATVRADGDNCLPCGFNITPQLTISKARTNTIAIGWMHEQERPFYVAVFIVKKLDACMLKQTLVNSGAQRAEYTRRLINEKFSKDADCEVATTVLTVSLNCPLSKVKMSLPCRGTTCSHLQCFDADFYLQINELKPSWKCPVCDRSVKYEDIRIDGYLCDVLQSDALAANDTEIILHKNGTWSNPRIIKLEGDISQPKPQNTTSGIKSVPTLVLNRNDNNIVVISSSDSEDDQPTFLKLNNSRFSKPLTGSSNTVENIPATDHPPKTPDLVLPYTACSSPTNTESSPLKPNRTSHIMKRRNAYVGDDPPKWLRNCLLIQPRRTSENVSPPSETELVEMQTDEASSMSESKSHGMEPRNASSPPTGSSTTSGMTTEIGGLPGNNDSVDANEACRSPTNKEMKTNEATSKSKLHSRSIENRISNDSDSDSQ